MKSTDWSGVSHESGAANGVSMGATVAAILLVGERARRELWIQFNIEQKKL